MSNKRIYLDNASTTPIDPRSVVGAVDKGSLYGLALYGFPLLGERLRVDAGVSPASFTVRELLRGLVMDLGDGGLNGKAGEDRVSVNGVTFEPQVLSLLFADVVRLYMNDPEKNRSGLVVSDVSPLGMMVARGLLSVRLALRAL